MQIAIAAETNALEPRVAASPETVKKLIGLGASVAVPAGAGLGSGISDAEFEAAGASIAATGITALKGADIVLAVRRPDEATLKAIKPGALVIATMDPYGNEAALAAMAKAGVSAFAMEFMPRITRAQVMDVLSSQANLAGYRAVIDGAGEYGRVIPMMMTAAGTCAGGAHFHHGCRRRGPSGHCHGAPARRCRDRHGCAARHQGAGRIARREVCRGGG